MAISPILEKFPAAFSEKGVARRFLERINREKSYGVRCGGSATFTTFDNH